VCVRPDVTLPTTELNRIRDEYQAQMRLGIYNAWGSGNRCVLAVLPTGGGKSVVFTGIAEDGHRQGLTEAVIAHRNELVSQLSMHLARRGIPHRVIASRAAVRQITAEHRRELGRSFVNPDARCSVVSVDTLIARKDDLAMWAMQVQRWTIDECFPAGTSISTPTGNRPIEDLQVGDTVLAFDEQTSTFHPRQVMRLFKNPTPPTIVDISINGSTLTTTLGHPFWTGRGWVEAEDLRDGDRCLVELHGVRGQVRVTDISCGLSTEEKWAGVLHPCLWVQTPQQESGAQTATRTDTGSEAVRFVWSNAHTFGQDVFGGMPAQNSIRNNGAHEPQVRIEAYETEQPDEAIRIATEDARYAEAFESSTRGARRERETADRSGTTADRHTHTVGVRATTAGDDRMGQITWSDALQTGHGASFTQDSNRSGWQFAQHTGPSSVRCPQGRIFEWCRVDRVAIQQSADHGRYGDGHVYNIEVDQFHTYVADGVVVHNCHHVLRENKWGKAVAMFPNAYGLGVTATPSRADGMGLGAHHDGVFETMILGPTMRDLIDMGALCAYEIAVPESDFEIDESKIAKSGDWSTQRMREASKRSHIVGDVVTEYLRRAQGKRAICFATDVETSNEIAQRFNDAGVAAASVSAKTPTEVRNDYIRRFRDGRITVLVNVDLFGEGFDVPAVEVVIMARPTASLAVYLQQFGRALRPMDGKPFGLVIDHVSNWKRHGFPDKPHIWTLDRRDKRAKREPDPDDIELTSCKSCSRPYEKVHAICPYCGEAPPAPAGGGRSIEQVDGDFFLLDREMVAQMQQAAKLENPGDMMSRIDHATGNSIAAKGAANRQMERIAAQQRLTAAIEQWAGCRRAVGDTDQMIFRRFYLTWGVDMISATAGKRAEMESLAALVEKQYA